MTFRDLALTSVFALGATGAAFAQSGERYDFNDLDADADGVVTLAELEAGFEEVGVDATGAQTVLEAQDTNGDGVIGRDEAGGDDAIYSVEDDENETD